MAQKEYNIGIIGDLHLDDRKVGKHKDYLANCLYVLDRIDELITQKALTHLILLGDIFGNTQHVVQRQSTRVLFTQYFARWNKQLQGHLYAVKGNHDQGAYTTDFDLLCAAGLVQTPSEADIGEYRFHFLTYGETDRKIQLAQGKENVVLAHAQFMIEGQTDYIRAPGGQELSDMLNLAGVSLVVCGHIHNPSYNYLSTSIGGNKVYLYYPGCPTRPRKERDLWDKAFMLYMHSVTDEENPDNSYVGEESVEIPLLDKATLFTDDSDSADETDNTAVGVMDIDALGAVLRDLQEYSLIAQGGYREQVKRLGAMDAEASEMVLAYLDRAESETANTDVNPD